MGYNVVVLDNPGGLEGELPCGVDPSDVLGDQSLRDLGPEGPATDLDSPVARRGTFVASALEFLCREHL